MLQTQSGWPAVDSLIKLVGLDSAFVKDILPHARIFEQGFKATFLLSLRNTGAD
jgi:hypothetical protein